MPTVTTALVSAASSGSCSNAARTTSPPIECATNTSRGRASPAARHSGTAAARSRHRSRCARAAWASNAPL